MAKAGLAFEFTETGASRVQKAISSTTGDALQLGSSFAVVANQSLELAKKVEEAAKAVYAFGKAGANAADVAASFTALGAAVPSVQAMRDALQGTVDETSMQQYAILAQRIGLTAAESEKAASTVASMAISMGRASEVGDYLDAVVKGQSEKLRELGLVIDNSSESFEGLTRSQKKLQVARELAAQSEIAGANAIESSTLQYAQAETAVADLISNLQVMANQVIIDSGVLDGLKAVIARVNEFAMENADTFSRVADVAGKILGPVLEGLALVFEYNAMVIEGVMFVLEPVIDMMSKLADAVRSLPDIFAKTARSVGVMEDSLDRIRSMAAETTRELQALADAQDELKASTDPVVISAEFLADQLAQNLQGAAGGTDQALRTIIGTAHDLDEALYLLDAAVAATAAEHSKLNEELAGEYMATAAIAADELAIVLGDHFEPKTKSAAKSVRDLQAAGLDLTWTLTGLSDALAGLAMRMADYESPTEQLTRRLADGFDEVRESIEGSIAASKGWDGVLRVLEGHSRRFASNVAGAFDASAEERAAFVAELNQQELSAIVATGQAYVSAASAVLDSIAPLADVGAVKAVLGFLESAATAALLGAQGNIPGAIQAGAAAAGYLTMQAFAESKGGSSGASASASSPASASAAASTPPSELDRGGRGMGDQTLVLRVGERTFGEVAIKSANAAARNRSMRLDSSIVGSTSSRRGRI